MQSETNRKQLLLDLSQSVEITGKFAALHIGELSGYS